MRETRRKASLRKLEVKNSIKKNSENPINESQERRKRVKEERRGVQEGEVMQREKQEKASLRKLGDSGKNC